MLLMTETRISRHWKRRAESALLQKAIGDDQKQMAGYKERLEIREVIGTRLAREVVLEPKPSGSR